MASGTIRVSPILSLLTFASVTTDAKGDFDLGLPQGTAAPLCAFGPNNLIFSFYEVANSWKSRVIDATDNSAKANATLSNVTVRYLAF